MKTRRKVTTDNPPSTRPQLPNLERINPEYISDQEPPLSYELISFVENLSDVLLQMTEYVQYLDRLGVEIQTRLSQLESNQNQ